MNLKITKTTPPARLGKRTRELFTDARALGFRFLGWLKLVDGSLVFAGFTNDAGGAVLILTGTGKPFDPLAVEFVSGLDRERWLTTTTFGLVSPQPKRGIFKYSHPDADLIALWFAHQTRIATLKAVPVRPIRTLRGLVDSILDYLRHEAGEPATPRAKTDDSLSPAADKFLAAATAEFNAKQAALRKTWRFASYAEWGFDQISGTFKLSFRDGAELQADGQVLGSYAKGGASWEWAWNNPNVLPAMARDSKRVKRLGQKLKISYLVAGMVPVPGGQFPSYLCAIGVKATDSAGVFRGSAGPVDVMILLKNLRWTKEGKRKRTATKRRRRST